MSPLRPLLRPLVLAALSCVACAGCALTSKAEPVLFRYFTPDSVTTTAAPAKNRGAGLELRIGHVISAAYVRDQIAFRDQTHEVGYYDGLRWSERPEAYVRRAVTRALFEDEGVHELVSRPGATLEIVIDAFEERRAPEHVAHVELTWLLRDDQAVRQQHTFTVERPIASPPDKHNADGLAAAMGAALHEAVDTIVNGTVEELVRPPSPTR